MAYTLASTASDGGTLWRAELEDDLGHLVDATRWTPSPRQAISDGEALTRGTYWVSDHQPRYLPAV